MESKRPSLSVVIPAYNSQAIIGRCLTAVMEAYPIDKEIIVIDDASTDDTYKIVSMFPVKLYRLNKNSGPAVARNYGFRQSFGDIVVFLDSDIIIMKHALMALVDVLEEKCAGATGGLTQPFKSNFVSDSYIVRIFGTSPIAETSVREIGSVGGCFVGYPRKVFEELGGYDENLRIGEDLDLNIRLGKAGYKQFLVTSAIGFHDHPSSISTLTRKWFQYGFWFFRVCMRHHLKKEILQILSWVLSFFLLLLMLLWSRELLLVPFLILTFWLPWLLYYGKFTVIFWIRKKKVRYLATPLVHQIIILSRTLGFLYAILKSAERKLER
ncbi:glycosyltransferase [Candidatus Bathyarchaeota archaeon]|nr:glycosyltransferase [Candidatus Bathyarchaeota archaeon]